MNKIGRTTLPASDAGASGIILDAIDEMIALDNKRRREESLDRLGRLIRELERKEEGTVILFMLLSQYAWRAASLNRAQDAIDTYRRLIRDGALLRRTRDREDLGILTFDLSRLSQLFLQSGETGSAYGEVAKVLPVFEGCDDPSQLMSYLSELAKVLVADSRQAQPRHKRLLKKLLTLLEMPTDEIERRCDSSFTQAVERTAKDMSAADRRFQGLWQWIKDTRLTRPRTRKAVVRRVREFLQLEPLEFYRRRALQRFVYVILM